MKNVRIAKVLRKEAWERAKQELVFLTETFKYEDAEHYDKAKKFLLMYIRIMEERIIK